MKLSKIRESVHINVVREKMFIEIRLPVYYLLLFVGSQFNGPKFTVETVNPRHTGTLLGNWKGTSQRRRYFTPIIVDGLPQQY